jgi:3-oxoacyl-[acyl-carrier-protein] synthase-3
MPLLRGDLTAHLLDLVRRVQEHLGVDPALPDSADIRFGDLLDSMGMVEFLMLLARDCGVTPGAIEECVARRFGTVAELASSLHAAGVLPQTNRPTQPTAAASMLSPVASACWLSAVAVRLPDTVQPAAVLNTALQRPAGWLESHAGITQRHVWMEQDALTAAAAAGRDCLERAALLVEEVGALLVTSEAPPLLTGLAAALHHRLGLRPETVALEVGGACTGFLAALWLAQGLVSRVGHVLIIAVEAPSRYLRVQPGPAGEAAALFGDAAAAAVLGGQSPGEQATPVAEVVLGVDGGAAELIQVERLANGAVELRLDGGPLAGRAVQTMAQTVRDLAQRHGLAVTDLRAVVAHAGNGRLPALLAHQLGVPPVRVWSETSHTGNLGTASLPVAWAAHQPCTAGPAVWACVGAGLTWAGAATGMEWSDSKRSLS